MNLTTEVVSAFFGAFAWLLGFAVTLNQIRKGFHYRFYTWSSFAWLCPVLFFIFWALANLFLRLDFAAVTVIMYLLSALFVLLKADTLKREQVNPTKLGIFLVLAVWTLVSLGNLSEFFVQVEIPNNAQLLMINLLPGLPFMGASAISFLNYTYCTFLVKKNAPPALKKYAWFYFGGFFIITIASSLWIVINAYLPGGLLLLVAVGGFMLVYSYAREPKLLFILPFRALRLTVLDTEAGLSLFTHTWNQPGDIADESLFSSMLQGISGILKESLKRGDVQEIRMADAIIIACRVPQYPVACVLVATRPTRSLRDGLKLFTEQFCEQFKAGFSTPNDVGQFSGAATLVASCFPHIPVYE